MAHLMCFSEVVIDGVGITIKITPVPASLADYIQECFASKVSERCRVNISIAVATPFADCRLHWCCNLTPTTLLPLPTTLLDVQINGSRLPPAGNVAMSF